MSVIDAHVHLYPPEVNADPVAWAAAHQEPLWAALCTRRRKDGRPVQGFPSVDDLLRAMDAADVAQAVLLGWYWENATTCAGQNRFYADCVRAHPDRLQAFATVQPANAEPADTGAVVALTDELRRCRDDGLCGLGELSPHAQGYAVDHAGLRAALEFAAAHAWPVNLHVTDPASRPFPGRVETPLDDFRRLVVAHPRVTFVLAHWGGGQPLADAPGVFYDTAASPLLYPPTVWGRVGMEFPANRVLFGSDYPLNLYPRAPGNAGPELAGLVREVRESLCEPVEQEAVLAGNARALLGRRAE